MHEETLSSRQALAGCSGVDVITVEEAQLRISNWVNLIGKLPEFQGVNAKFIPRAVLIPYEDLKKILDDYEHQLRHHHHYHHTSKYPLGIRVYFGLLPSIASTGGETEYQVKTGVVAVRHDHRDMPYKYKKGPDADDPPGDYVFDFTSPCPSTCDEESPLFISPGS